MALMRWCATLGAQITVMRRKNATGPFLSWSTGSGQPVLQLPAAQLAFLLACLLFGASAVSPVYASKVIVGGKDGWAPEVDYGAWSAQNPLEIGDVVVFTWRHQSEGLDVLELPDREAFDACVVDRGVQLVSKSEHNKGVKVNVTNVPRFFTTSSEKLCPTMRVIIAAASAARAPTTTTTTTEEEEKKQKQAPQSGSSQDSSSKLDTKRRGEKGDGLATISAWKTVPTSSDPLAQGHQDSSPPGEEEDTAAPPGNSPPQLQSSADLDGGNGGGGGAGTSFPISSNTSLDGGPFDGLGNSSETTVASLGGGGSGHPTSGWENQTSVALADLGDVKGTKWGSGEKGGGGGGKGGVVRGSVVGAEAGGAACEPSSTDPYSMSTGNGSCVPAVLTTTTNADSSSGGGGTTEAEPRMGTTRTVDSPGNGSQNGAMAPSPGELAVLFGTEDDSSSAPLHDGGGAFLRSLLLSLAASLAAVAHPQVFISL